MVECMVWQADKIEEVKEKIFPGSILLLQNAVVLEKNPTFSRSHTHFDLSVCSHTKVVVMKAAPVYVPNVLMDSDMPSYNIEDCLNGLGRRIEITAYIKNQISVTSLPGVKINQGCLSDCKYYKLEVRMPEVVDMSKFSVGSHVKIIGNIKFASTPHLLVDKPSDVKIASEEIKKLNELMKGRNVLKRPALNSSSSVVVKKLKN